MCSNAQWASTKDTAMSLTYRRIYLPEQCIIISRQITLELEKLQFMSKTCEIYVLEKFHLFIVQKSFRDISILFNYPEILVWNIFEYSP